MVWHISIVCRFVALSQTQSWAHFRDVPFFVTQGERMEEYNHLSEEERDHVLQCLRMEADCRDLWIKAIQCSPRLGNFCKYWHNFTTLDWARLLSNNIQFLNMAPLYKMSAAEWFIILNKQHSLVNICPVINEMPDEYWNLLLQKYPHLKRNQNKTE